MAALKLVVTRECFGEIAQAMTKAGVQLGQGNIEALTTIQLEKGSEIDQPTDWPLVKLRKDCLVDAAKVYETLSDKDKGEFFEFADKYYQYALDGTTPTAKTKGW